MAQAERDDQLDAAKRWVAEVQAAYADGGYAAGDGPAPPLDEMEWLIAEVDRLLMTERDGTAPSANDVAYCIGLLWSEIPLDKERHVLDRLRREGSYHTWEWALDYPLDHVAESDHEGP